ncbi:sphingolipid delta-4 desaturase [Binucleata daphniae]
MKDKRHPTYVGTWKRSIPYKDDDFAIDKEYDEPHQKRKTEILSKHPEILKLYGPSYKTKYVIILVACLHVLGLYISTKINSRLFFFIFCYVYGGTLGSLSGILLHETTHQLVSKNSTINLLFSYIANIPVIVPMASSFKKYHLDHHYYLGVKGKDPDLPLEIEYKMVRGNTTCKIIYICIYPAFYIGRSFLIKKRIQKSEIINIVSHSFFIYLSYSYFGFISIWYWVLSSWLSYSIFPAAAHLIQEHFTFEDGQETYSYYGKFNMIFLNIGYHNEHHDFSKVAWDKLPEIQRIAPEYYTCLTSQKSWFGVLYNFITKPTYGPQSRVARTLKTHLSGRSRCKND